MSGRMITVEGGFVRLTCVLDVEEKEVPEIEQWLQTCADKVNEEVNNTISDLMAYGTASLYLGNCVPPEDLYTFGESSVEIEDPDRKE